jgi:hypothetical protein
MNIGHTLSFVYNGKNRLVKVEGMKTGLCMKNGHAYHGVKHFTGWDALADAPIGGYRTFTMDKCQDVKVVA